LVSQNSSEQYITLSLVIPQYVGEKVLMLPVNGGWALPTVDMPPPPTDSWWLDAAHITRAVPEHLGLRTTVLRCLHVGSDAEGQSTGTFLMERHDPDWTFPGPAEWFSPDILPDPFGRLVTEGTQSSENAPWTRPGWFGEAAEWMRMQLEARGLRLESEVEQVRSWFLSCLLRVERNEGDYYLKVVPPLFRHEPPLTLDLSERHPGFVPQVVSVDVERRWTLMRNAPGVKLVQHPDKALYLPRWEAILRRFAQIQLDYIPRVDDLLAMGCFDFRLDRLYAGAEVLFAELPHLFGEASNLSTEEIGLLQASLPSIKTICDELASSGLPPTLHHGDFHSGNILCDSDCVVLDWSGFVVVSHPFLFLTVVSEELTDSVVMSRMFDAYLPVWSAYGPLDELRRLAGQAILVGWLAGALGHRRQLAIRDGAWDREQELGNLLYCLKFLLRLLAAA
jgi:hypothetical protein